MIFTHLTLKNWKNFKEVDVDLNSRMFIIGSNAAGKSNFLDVFRFLADVSQNGLTQAVESRGGMSAIRCLAAKRVNDVAIKVTIDDEWVYELAIEGKKGATPKVKTEKVSYAKASKGKVIKRNFLNRPTEADKKDAERLTQTALEQVNSNQNFRQLANFFKTISYRHILPQAVRTPRDFSPSVVNDDPYGRDLVVQIWNTNKKTRNSRLKRINEALKVAVPQLDDLSVKMNPSTGVPHLETRYQHWRLYGAKQDESSFSDGTLRLLALLWSLLETGGPLLLEEPELSLHDEIVRQLPTMFAKLEKSKKQATRQIFVSTHSQALLSDIGIGPGEVLTLLPGDEGTEVISTSESDAEMMRESRLTAADFLLQKTNPRNVGQLSLFDI